MKGLRFCALPALVIGVAASSASANLLANPGFEDPITTDGAPFVGSWEGFNGGAGSQALNSAVMPRSGLQHLELSITRTDNTFAGVFQDVPNLTPGTPVVFSGFNLTTTDPLGAAGEIRIEWRKSSNNSEVSRTPNLVPTLTAQYTPFTLSATVPAGADTARVVYAIQSFGPESSNTGTIFVDDLSLDVPEPTAAALGGLGALGWMGMGRRRAIRR